jgi:hypothetical protein
VFNVPPNCGQALKIAGDLADSGPGWFRRVFSLASFTSRADAGDGLAVAEQRPKIRHNSIVRLSFHRLLADLRG